MKHAYLGPLLWMWLGQQYRLANEGPVERRFDRELVWVVR